MRILIVEPICSGIEHVPTNSVLIRAVQSAFPAARVGVAAEAEQFKGLANIAPAAMETVTYMSIRPAPRYRLSGLRRTAEELHSWAAIYIKFRPTHCLFLACTTSTIHAVSWIDSLGLGAHRNGFVLHGMLSDIDSPRRRNPIANYFSVRNTLSMFGERFRLIALENAIVDQLRVSGNPLATQIVPVDIPLPSDLSVVRHPLDSSPIRIGYLGFANVPKGYPEFVKMAREVTAAYPGRFEFVAVGSYEHGFSPPDDFHLTERPETLPLDRKLYRSRLARVHYVCLPFDEHYRLVASGTAVDAIAAGKPLITRRSASIDALFTGCTPGVLFEHVEELRSFWSSLVSEDRESIYAAHEAEAIRASENRSFLKTTEQIKSIFD